MTIPHPRGSRTLAAGTALLLGLVVSVAFIVGVYAIRNPNRIQFGGPLPALSELVAGGVAVALAVGVRSQRRRGRPALFVADAGAAAVALLLLGFVAFVLSFNQL
jgi:NO-binding membrane sensor protein with MHYT domain